MPTRQDIYLRMLQHVPDVQRSGHVGRRNDNGENRRRRIRICSEQNLCYPKFGPLWFDFLRLVTFWNFASHQRKFLHECLALSAIQLPPQLLFKNDLRLYEGQSGVVNYAPVKLQPSSSEL